MVHEDIVISVVGKIDSVGFHQCAAIAENLASMHEMIQADVRGLVETDFQAFLKTELAVGQ